MPMSARSKGVIRQGHAQVPTEGSDERCEMAFAAPQWALTPGQSVVLYESRVCLGGGIIA